MTLDTNSPLPFSGPATALTRRLQEEPSVFSKQERLQIAAEYAAHGMKIHFVGSLGTPFELKTRMGFQANDFGVCGFMGSSPGDNPAIGDLTQMYAALLVDLDKRYDLNMPRISGGGSWSGAQPSDTTSLRACSRSLE